jgi:hypothetical protein
MLCYLRLPQAKSESCSYTVRTYNGLHYSPYNCLDYYVQFCSLIFIKHFYQNMTCNCTSRTSEWPPLFSPTSKAFAGMRTHEHPFNEHVAFTRSLYSVLGRGGGCCQLFICQHAPPQQTVVQSNILSAPNLPFGVFRNFSYCTALLSYLLSVHYFVWKDLMASYPCVRLTPYSKPIDRYS